MTAELAPETVTRDDLLDALRNMNKTAKAISRRGFVGIYSAEYGRRHDDINELLDQLLGH